MCVRERVRDCTCECVRVRVCMYECVLVCTCACSVVQHTQTHTHTHKYEYAGWCSGAVTPQKCYDVVQYPDNRTGPQLICLGLSSCTCFTKRTAHQTHRKTLYGHNPCQDTHSSCSGVCTLCTHPKRKKNTTHAVAHARTATAHSLTQHIRTHTHTHIHTYIHTYTYTFIHTLSCTHTHTHTHTQHNTLRLD